MDEEDILRHKVLYLFASGWNDIAAIQRVLSIPDKVMGEILQWLIDEGYLVPYTIH